MIAQEYKKLEQCLQYGIRQVRISNSEFEEMKNAQNSNEQHLLELKAQNHRGYTEGILHVLSALNYKHKDMEILSKELD